MTKIVLGAALLAGFLAAGSAAAESFRCGSWIATPEMTMAASRAPNSGAMS